MGTDIEVTTPTYNRACRKISAATGPAMLTWSCPWPKMVLSVAALNHHQAATSQLTVLLSWKLAVHCAARQRYGGRGFMLREYLFTATRTVTVLLAVSASEALAAKQSGTLRCAGQVAAVSCTGCRSMLP